MKSVIAQGSTVVKAIEEALKKADMPQEFFVKLLEQAQTGFLGFGSKKAKIALFFKKEVSIRRSNDVLSQDSYEDLFDNRALKKQIENQESLAIQSTKSENKPEVRKNNQQGSNNRRPGGNNNERQNQRQDQQIEKKDVSMRPMQQTQRRPIIQRPLNIKPQGEQQKSDNEQRRPQHNQRPQRLNNAPRPQPQGDQADHNAPAGDEQSHSNYPNRRRSRYFRPRGPKPTNSNSSNSNNDSQN